MALIPPNWFSAEAPRILPILAAGLPAVTVIESALDIVDNRPQPGPGRLSDGMEYDYVAPIVSPWVVQS